MPQTNLAKAQRNAAKLGVTVKPSKVKHKKLDVLKNGKKLASIGDIRYSDLLQHGDEKRAKKYKQRFEQSRHITGTPSYFADKILWS